MPRGGKTKTYKQYCNKFNKDLNNCSHKKRILKKSTLKLSREDQTSYLWGDHTTGLVFVIRGAAQSARQEVFTSVSS